MKFMLSLLALVAIVSASPTPNLPLLNPGGIGGVFKGPNSETIIKGPDGSVISSAHAGGEVHTQLDPIIVEEPAPIIVPVETPVAVAVETPVDKEQASDLIGPSGRITTQGQSSVVAGPASTTITGPAVVAETVVKGPPIIGNPIPILDAVPLNTETHVSSVSVSVTASPIATVSTGPILHAVTASALGGPIATVTGVPVASITATGAPIAGVTGAPVSPIAVTAAPLINSQLDFNEGAVSSSSVINGYPVATGLRAASASVNYVTPTALPVISSTVAPPEITGIESRELFQVNDQIDFGYNQRGQLLGQDQVAIDNQQINLNPALIPTSNIIPPEIGVSSRIGNIDTSRAVDGRLLVTPTPRTAVLEPTRTPGLSATVAPSNIQKIDVGNIQLTPEQQLALRNQQPILLNEVTHTTTVNEDPRLVNGANRNQQQYQRVADNQQQQQYQQVADNQQQQQYQQVVDNQQQQQYQQVADNQQQQQYQQVADNQQQQQYQQVADNRQQQQYQQIVDNQQQQQYQQVADNQQQQQYQQVVGDRQQQQYQQVVDIRPRHEIIVDPRRSGLVDSNNQQEFISSTAPQQFTVPSRNDVFGNRNGPGPTLANVQQQQILSGELAKSGVDSGQVQLTNVPLSNTSPLPGYLVSSEVRVTPGPFPRSWINRRGRETSNEKVN